MAQSCARLHQSGANVRQTGTRLRQRCANSLVSGAQLLHGCAALRQTCATLRQTCATLRQTCATFGCYGAEFTEAWRTRAPRLRQSLVAGANYKRTGGPLLQICAKRFECHGRCITTGTDPEVSMTPPLPPGNDTELESARYGETTCCVTASVTLVTVTSWPVIETGADTV